MDPSSLVHLVVDDGAPTSREVVNAGGVIVLGSFKGSSGIMKQHGSLGQASCAVGEAKSPLPTVYVGVSCGPVVEFPAEIELLSLDSVSDPVVADFVA